MKPAYYNEIDGYAAEWLRNLIAAGHLPAGDVDTRSIVDVAADDLVGYGQCHFFSGLGGWALAARLAGWPDDRELWTGSCPCQPFSVAGKGAGIDDERHLWPHQFRLIRARRPAVWMGEQVAAAVGKDWLDGVLTDLESIGYAGRAAVVPACAVDGPHRRDRLWLVAHAAGQGRGQVGLPPAGNLSPHGDRAGNWAGDASEVGDGARGRGVADPNEPVACEGRQQRGGEQCGTGGDPGACAGGAMAFAGRNGHDPANCDAPESSGNGSDDGLLIGSRGQLRRGSAWGGAGWIIGHDGKARRVEPSIRLLAHGVPARVGKLRAYGNAIAPPLAAEVIAAYLDCMPEAA